MNSSMNDYVENANASASAIVDITPAYNAHVGLAVSLAGLCLIHPLTSITSIFNFWLIFNSNLLHFNLKCILLAQSATIVMTEMFDIVYLSLILAFSNAFFPYANVFVLIGSLLGICRNLIAHPLFFERAMASWLFRTYEKSTRPLISVGSLAICMLVAVVISLSINGDPLTTNATAFFGGLFIEIATFLESIALIALYISNWRIYHLNGSTMPLSLRFQLSENIRTTRQLLPTFFFHSFNSFMEVLGLFLHYFGVMENPVSIMLYFNICLRLNGFVCFLIELTVITHHPSLKKKAILSIKNILKIFSKNCIGIEGDWATRTNNSNGKGINANLKNLRGDQLRISIPDEQEKHFKMLGEAWK